MHHVITDAIVKQFQNTNDIEQLERDIFNALEIERDDALTDAASVAYEEIMFANSADNPTARDIAHGKCAYKIGKGISKMRDNELAERETKKWKWIYGSEVKEK